MDDGNDRLKPGPLVSIRGLHHYTISVADLDESVAWYAATLGFQAPASRHDHPWGPAGYLAGPGCLLEMLEVPDGRAVPPYARGPEPDTDLTVCGHKHMALLLGGTLDSALVELHGLNASVVDVKKVSLEGIGEFKAAFIADNSGGLIELPENGGSPHPSAAPPATGPDGRPRPLVVQGLHHVALAVPDREQAIEWYSRVLGLTVATTFEVPAIGLRTAMMQGPGFWIELHSMAGALPVPVERRDPRTDLLTLGNKYFALVVDQLDGVPEVLRKNGVSIGAEISAGGERRLFVSDMAGNPVELVGS